MGERSLPEGGRSWCFRVWVIKHASHAFCKYVLDPCIDALIFRVGNDRNSHSPSTFFFPFSFFYSLPRKGLLILAFDMVLVTECLGKFIGMPKYSTIDCKISRIVTSALDHYLRAWEKKKLWSPDELLLWCWALHSYWSIISITHDQSNIIWQQ